MQVCFLLVKEGLAHEEDAVIALHFRCVADLTLKNSVIKVQAKRTEFGAYPFPLAGLLMAPPTVSSHGGSRPLNCRGQAAVNLVGVLKPLNCGSSPGYRGDTDFDFRVSRLCLRKATNPKIHVLCVLYDKLQFHRSAGLHTRPYCTT